ncbi:MAG: lactonase family protein [Segetibacter sp.]|nr:lactonase family protein [Segetibacter sp.]
MRKYFLLPLMLLPLLPVAQTFHLFIGTYTGKGSKGIYVYKFNASKGTAEWVSNTDSAANPSYLTVSPTGKYIYAVNETGGDKPGTISSYSFDRGTGKLSFINQQLTGGDAPCYVSITKGNNLVMVANYSGGSLSAFGVNNDGSLNPFSQLIQHSGSGVNKQRQDKPHVHSVVFSPMQDYLFTSDLGLDKVMIYKVNAEDSKPLSPANPPFVAVRAGSGPRHFTFHPNGKFAYLMQEMSGTVGAYKYNNGNLTFLEDVATHRSGFKGRIGSADIHVSPDGKFLYASNRGDENNIAIFSINQSTGKLKLKGFQSTRGRTPRNFMIDPTGNYLLAANQDTDNIVIFKRNKVTGLLKETGKQIKVSMPVCLQMLK